MGRLIAEREYLEGLMPGNLGLPGGTRQAFGETMANDHFSAQAAFYARHRPTYPVALFEWLSAQVDQREQAWDCACGNGQATIALAERFTRVTGTDSSAEQLRFAPLLPNIAWKVARAEDSGLATGSMDLVTVAQALHWLDLDRFWREVKRVAKPGGLVAVWSYGVFRLPIPELQEVCDDFYENVVGGFWPPERRIVEAGYGALDFPFKEIQAPGLMMEARWALDDLMGYFSSWSATTRYLQALGNNPLPALRSRLEPHWPLDEARLSVVWPLSMRVGRV